MKAFTYFEEVPQLDKHVELALIDLWKMNWKRRGFEPVVLGREDAMKHPFYEDSIALISDLPSVNPKGYDLACYLRWLAVGAREETFVLMSDYDVMNYTFEPVRDNRQLTIYEKHVPSLVSGAPHHFVEQYERFVTYEFDPTLDKHDGKDHCSDMTIIESGDTGAVMLDVVKHYGEPGWESAPAVHYNNGSMGPSGKKPRFLHIPKLR